MTESDRKFMMIALNGRTSDPKAKKSRMKVAETTTTAIHGRTEPKLTSVSTSWAVWPPTNRWDPNGGRTARTWATID
jgi:hypothetical protein